MVKNEIPTLIVYELEPRQKHPTIFEWFDRLLHGESFIIINDHDPAPLYYELQAERQEALGGFEYLQSGPDIWKVQISRAATQDTADTCAVVPRSVGSDKTGVDQPGTCAVDNKPGIPVQQILDVTLLSPKMKHPTIFEWFEALAPGHAFTIKNDHDPKPLYYQMLGQLGPVFNWEYREQGPDCWQVVIMKKEIDEITIGELAAKDARKAAAMKNMGIDFCCGGGKTVAQAAIEAGITEKEFYQKLDETATRIPVAGHTFDRWDLVFLIDYIYNEHHKYFYENKDNLLQLATKVSDVHSASHPELGQVKQLVEHLFSELQLHFIKEEQVIFPYIKELSKCDKDGTSPASAIQMSEGPLAMMHMEHEAAGDLLKQIRAVTNNYFLPETACNSYRQLYTGLSALEADLHQHIHLENNILFPKALEAELKLKR